MAVIRAELAHLIAELTAFHAIARSRADLEPHCFEAWRIWSTIRMIRMFLDEHRWGRDYDAVSWPTLHLVAAGLARIMRDLPPPGELESQLALDHLRKLATAESRAEIQALHDWLPDRFLMDPRAIQNPQSENGSNENESTPLQALTAPPDVAERGNRLIPNDPRTRAYAAAITLMRDGKPVSLNAACKLAGVDRKNLRKRHPEIADQIKALARPDHAPRRGRIDARTGDVDGVDEDEE